MGVKASPLAFGGGASQADVTALTARVAALEAFQASLIWTAVPFAAGNFTASAGTWTVAAGDVKAFRYAILGKSVLLELTIDAGATSATPADLFVALPAAITPLKEIRGFMLTNASGSSEAGFFYINAGVATINLRRVAGVWPISASFQLALELFLEIA